MGDYEVGYGKPPKHGQFQKGRSGNPKGRPKGTKNLKTDLEEELRELITVREGGNPKVVSKQRAMLKSLTAKAVQGDARAAAIIIEMMYRLLHEDEAEDLSRGPSPEDKAIVEGFKTRFLRGWDGAQDEGDTLKASLPAGGEEENEND